MNAREWVINGTEGLYREGEETIAEDSYWSLLYVIRELKGRFIAGEKKIKKISEYSGAYNQFLEMKRIPVTIISKNTGATYHFY